jgi:hypothetical protein
VSERYALVEVSDGETPDAIGSADPMVLRGLPYQLTGDRAVLALDPDFDDPLALSAGNKRIREERIEFPSLSSPGSPDLMEKMTPVNPAEKWQEEPMRPISAATFS